MAKKKGKEKVAPVARISCKRTPRVGQKKRIEGQVLRHQEEQAKTVTFEQFTAYLRRQRSIL